MTPYEIMLSESQERMLIVLENGKEEQAKKIFDKWNLDFAVIGKTTKSKKIKVFSTPDGPIEAVSELTLGMIITMLREVINLNDKMHKNIWEREIGNLLFKKNVLISPSSISTNMKINGRIIHVEMVFKNSSILVSVLIICSFAVVFEFTS